VKVRMMAKKLWSMWAVALLTIKEQTIGRAKKQWWVKSLKSVQMRRLSAKIVRTRIHSAFHVSFDSAALQKVKKSKMDRGAIKDFIYGGLSEIMNNRQYFYKSTVGQGYSHFTEEGEKALVEYLNLVSWKMIEAENNELNARSKEMVIRGLKGENK
jgi:hypothetical protein